jgi:hypothetical protein
MTLNRWKFKALEIQRMDCLRHRPGFLCRWIAHTARWMHVNQVRADSNRVFELRVYHAVPGKLPALESRFRDTTSKLLAKHDLKVVGYWVPEDAPAWDNTFVLWWRIPAGRKRTRTGTRSVADPEFQEVLKSEQANKLVEKIDSTYMRPTDFSPMK